MEQIAIKFVKYMDVSFSILLSYIGPNSIENLLEY